ncbi:MAG TPA: type I-E CRISPR-associated protein Cas7/Cse4/CasC [Streptosporangiaceae bacterium]|jgi:CRISPR system Cascade subunit CasC
MTRTILDLHLLQTVPPSNLNRDDTGTPKTAMYGGARRARVSSQAWKRATRHAFHDLLDPSELGVRTKRVADLVAEAIQRQDGSVTAADGWALAASVITAATGSKIEAPRGKAEDGVAPESKYLMFLSAAQVDALAALAIEGRDDITTFVKDKENKARAKQIANSRHSVDIALFGRMVADGAGVNVDAAAQVAHAISVHRVDNESDYYTAVDDRKNREAEDDLGAGMIGNVDFNSATLYRYAALDVDLLRRNLGMGLREDEDPATPLRRAVEAFVEGFICSLPTGKINTFGNHTLPDVVIAKLRTARPVSFVSAFEAPCRPDPETGGYLRGACDRLAHYITDIETTYGITDDDHTWTMRTGDNTEPLVGLGERMPLRDLITTVGEQTAARQG